MNVCLPLRWLLGLWMRLAAVVVLPAATFSYDAQNQMTVAYDGGGEPAVGCDAACVVAACEKKDRTIGNRVLFAEFAEFLAAKNAPVAIGENMTRVNGYSRSIGGHTIDDWLAGRRWSQQLSAGLLQLSWAELRNPDLSSALGWATFATAGVGLIAGTVDAAANVVTLGGKSLVTGGIKQGGKALLHSADDVGVGAYRLVGGHHIHAKKAFEGVAGYDLGEALAISDDLLRQYGVRHADITAAQQRLFRELADSGAANTLTHHSRIAYQAMVEAGMPADVAKDLVIQSQTRLIQSGIVSPNAVPWGRR